MKSRTCSIVCTDGTEI